MEARDGLPFFASVAADRAVLASGNALVVCHGQLAAPISPTALRVLTLFANDSPPAHHAKVVTPRHLMLCVASDLATRSLARERTQAAVALLAVLDTPRNVSCTPPRSLPLLLWKRTALETLFMNNPSVRSAARAATQRAKSCAQVSTLVLALRLTCRQLRVLL